MSRKRKSDETQDISTRPWKGLVCAIYSPNQEQTFMFGDSYRTNRQRNEIIERVEEEMFDQRARKIDDVNTTPDHRFICKDQNAEVIVVQEDIELDQIERKQDMVDILDQYADFFNGKTLCINDEQDIKIKSQKPTRMSTKQRQRSSLKRTKKNANNERKYREGFVYSLSGPDIDDDIREFFGYELGPRTKLEDKIHKRYTKKQDMIIQQKHEKDFKSKKYYDMLETGKWKIDLVQFYDCLSEDKQQAKMELMYYCYFWSKTKKGKMLQPKKLQMIHSVITKKEINNQVPPRKMRYPGMLWLNQKFIYRKWNGKVFKDMCEKCGKVQPSYGIQKEDGTIEEKWCGTCKIKHPNAVSVKKMCEDCGEFRASYGIQKEDGTIERKWCGTCKIKHPNAISTRQMCEDCGKIQSHYGIQREDGTIERKWCGTCKTKHPDSVSTSKMCEDCRKVQPRYGIQREDGTIERKYCGTCKIKHSNSVSNRKMCESCNKVSPSYGIQRKDGTIERKWCVTCKPKHLNPISTNKICEDCNEVQSSYGIQSEDGTIEKKWCATCRIKHPNSVSTGKMCEDCNKITACYGIQREDGTIEKKWCFGCSKQHKNSERVNQCLIERCMKNKGKDGYCTKHHPDYIPLKTGSSRIACEFLDAFKKQMKLASIQHIHYDRSTKNTIGDEHQIETTKFKADGFVNPDEKHIIPVPTINGYVIEFHGHEFHGYPNNDKFDQLNHFNQTYGKLYEKTMRKMQTIKDLGYTVIYIWESDFKKWKKQQVLYSLWSFCHVF